jgi:hypothetical protein
VPIAVPLDVAVSGASAGGKPDQVAAAATAATASTTATAQADQKLTCHMEIPTGSRVGVRVCETAAQRKAREDAVRDTRDRLNRQSPGCQNLTFGGCSGGG